MACAHFESISKGKKDEILSNFKITVRYSLLSRSKHYLKITKKGLCLAGWLECLCLVERLYMLNLFKIILFYYFSGKELKALLQADDELFSEIALANPDDSTHSTGHHAAINQQMRKKKALQASGMEDIINAIDQVCCVTFPPSLYMHTSLTL